MAKNIDRITERLGAKVICQVPDVGGGAFGMARLAGVISALQSPRATVAAHILEEAIARVATEGAGPVTSIGDNSR